MEAEYGVKELLLYGRNAGSRGSMSCQSDPAQLYECRTRHRFSIEEYRRQLTSVRWGRSGWGRGSAAREILVMVRSVSFPRKDRPSPRLINHLSINSSHSVTPINIINSLTITPQSPYTNTTMYSYLAYSGRKDTIFPQVSAVPQMPWRRQDSCTIWL